VRALPCSAQVQLLAERRRARSRPALALYGHLFPDQLDEVAEALDAARAAAVAHLLPTAEVVNLGAVRETARPPGIQGV
jgi:hypothetical protein